MIELNESDIERFWNKVDIRNKNQCWHWKGSVIWRKSIEVRHKYGVFTVRKKKYKAHRVSYMLINGRIPDNHVVRHECDNPKCCNPNHLISGTQHQNDMDRTIRGRTRNQHLGRINSEQEKEYAGK